MKNALFGALVLGLVGCGGGNEQEAQQEAQAAANELAAALNMATQEAAMTAQPTQMAATPTANTAGGSNFGTVTLNPGFMPDPHREQGTSGGGVNASTLNPSCAGWVAQTPDHLFVASANFANLRVMAHSDADITLVVQKPDGTYLCNDDSEGLNPLVSGPFPPGTYKIWVGSYEQGVNSRYTLGFSELATVNPSALAGG